MQRSRTGGRSLRALILIVPYIGAGSRAAENANPSLLGPLGGGVRCPRLNWGNAVPGDDAYWLDDHLLHTQRWAAAGYSIKPLARV